jgi:hypothetical protein
MQYHQMLRSVIPSSEDAHIKACIAYNAYIDAKFNANLSNDLLIIAHRNACEAYDSAFNADLRILEVLHHFRK